MGPHPLPSYRQTNTSVTSAHAAWSLALAHESTIRKLIAAAVARGTVAEDDAEDTYNSALLLAVELALQGTSENYTRHLTATLYQHINSQRPSTDAMDRADTGNNIPDRPETDNELPARAITTPVIVPLNEVPPQYRAIVQMLRAGKSLNYIAGHTGRNKKWLIRHLVRRYGYGEQNSKT